ncbi:adenosylcobinamide-GDP ribazoletransferase [Mumia zhuanghuii]|uniref:Adenosylcobinamide-GDP ribazoletransferase n=1 Tax=Mumia zhuanghuii TaxID=2585211 RepID=A0A5Q6S5F4_9ACTN|nr:adenosylcobinamide-GDP ribazoletransferase [Mumia zhuanghuii]
MADGLLLAAGTFSTVRFPAPSTVDRGRARVAMLAAPIAAVPLGAAAALVSALGDRLSLPVLVTGALAVAAVALGTRALHLDGLADTVDGLSAPYDRERRLAIMKSGDVGPAGAVGLTLVLLVQAAALGSLAGRDHGWLLVGTLVCVSRAAVLVACAAPVPAATPGGLGAAVAGSVPVFAAAGAATAYAGVLSLAFAAAGVPWWQAPLAVGVAAVAVALLVRRAVTLLGGITGDVIGAAIEVALVALGVVTLAT